MMKPKIAILSCATGGGAGIAAKRLADALSLLDDVSCDFIDATALGGLPEEAIFDGSATNRIISDTHFTAEYPGFVRQWLVNMLSRYDIVNFHWATMLVTVSEILAIANRGNRVILTMHDFFYSTGGCHYQAGCKGQRGGCTQCPQVNEDIFLRSAVARAFQEKMKLLTHENVSIVAPSHYVANRIREMIGNPPDKVHVIRNPLRISNSKCKEFTLRHDTARKVLIVADSFGERRKNIQMSIDAACAARDQYIPSLQLHLVGNPIPEVTDYCQQLNLDIVVHGHISDSEKLAQMYRSCGILVTCSSDDNWPNVLVEAGVCGTLPVVGPGHGCEEFVREYGLDLVAEDYSASSFAKQIWKAFTVIGQPSSSEMIGLMSDRIANDHSENQIRNNYIALLKKLIVA
jgi:glycosyltransferase involved in cell wall biosynthesis